MRPGVSLRDPSRKPLLQVSRIVTIRMLAIVKMAVVMMNDCGGGSDVRDDDP